MSGTIAHNSSGQVDGTHKKKSYVCMEFVEQQQQLCWVYAYVAACVPRWERVLFAAPHIIIRCNRLLLHCEHLAHWKSGGLSHAYPCVHHSARLRLGQVVCVYVLEIRCVSAMLTACYIVCKKLTTYSTQKAHYVQQLQLTSCSSDQGPHVHMR